MIIQYQEFNGDIQQEEWDQWDVMSGATAIVGKPNSVRSKVCCGYHRMGCRPDVFLLVLNVGNGWDWWLLG